MKVLPLLRLWRCRDIILYCSHFIGFDRGTEEHILCVSLRLCVKSLFTRTAWTLAVFFTQRRKVSQSICGIIFLFAMRGEGRQWVPQYPVFQSLGHPFRVQSITVQFRGYSLRSNTPVTERWRLQRHLASEILKVTERWRLQRHETSTWVNCYIIPYFYELGE